MTMMMIMMIVVVSSSEVQTMSQQGCTSTSTDLPNRECGSNRAGFTGELPHGPYCCEAEYQGCCTRAYGDLDARCVNRTSDPWRNQCQSFCTFDITRHTNESSFYTSTCYKTEMMSDTSTSLGFFFPCQHHCSTRPCQIRTLRIHLLKFVR